MNDRTPYVYWNDKSGRIQYAVLRLSGTLWRSYSRDLDCETGFWSQWIELKSKRLPGRATRAEAMDDLRVWASVRHATPQVRCGPEIY